MFKVSGNKKRYLSQEARSELLTSVQDLPCFQEEEQGPDMEEESGSQLQPSPAGGVSLTSSFTFLSLLPFHP